MLSVLLADDDTELTELLSEYLSAHDMLCTVVEDGEAALEKLSDAQQHYDLMVLDIMMPKMDGLSVLKQLPTDNRLPVIMLTAKGDEIDRIIGLELGADDYLGKPCNPRELLARINAVVKRSRHSYASTATTSSATTAPDSLLQMDESQRLCQINGETLTLTGTEFDLLYVLWRNKGTAIEKATLSEQVLQRELQPFDRSLDVHISRLRKKLSLYHDNPIRAIRGKGYLLAV